MESASVATCRGIINAKLLYSFLRNNAFRHATYAGRRVKRGLFRSSDGTPINADLNGAYNILRKVCPDAFGGRTGVALHGER